MTERGEYMLIARMDVDPDKEELFNEVYDEEHLPALLSVPGVYSVGRFTREPMRLSIGGEMKAIAAEDGPKYTAVVSIESPDVLASDAWTAAVEWGRWPEQVRPFTRNRDLVRHKRLG